MGWLRRLFRRPRQQREEPLSFEETEARAEEQLAADYAATRQETLDDVVSQLSDDTLTPPKEMKVEVPVDFHVEEASADDLLKETPMDDHYGMARGEAVDPETADEHLKEAKATESDMSAYQKVEVPVSDEDIDWLTE